MYRIGEFSKLSKTTIKTLRYYEKEKLLIPHLIDQNNNYRYYDYDQLIELSRIIKLREIGISIKDIKKVLNGYKIEEILENRKNQIENDLVILNNELSNINKIMEEKNMEEKIVIKNIPGYTVYYKDGVVKDFSEIGDFVVKSGEECLELNPNIECIHPDYCYVNYLDGEYRESDFKIRYAQAVKAKGKENGSIKFMDIEPVKAICIEHKGAYSSIRESYNKIMKYIMDNGLEIIDNPREHYIDGCWNKEDESEYLTEIQVPVKEK